MPTMDRHAILIGQSTSFLAVKFFAIPSGIPFLSSDVLTKSDNPYRRCSMIELQLSTKSMSKPIVMFDGHVIEFFYDDLTHGSRRVHVGHIKSIEILPVGKGKEKYSLQIKGEYMLVVTD